MLRRAFFTSLPATLAALLGLGRVRADAAPSIDEPTHNAAGAILANCYRLQPNGQYQRIRRLDAKPGDTIIMLGLDSDRLFMAHRLVVDKDGVWMNPTGADVAVSVVEGSAVELVTGGRHTVEEA